MAVRVTSGDVSPLIWDYDATVSLSPFITTANIVTDRLSALDTDSQLDSDTLAEIEKYLTAHFYTHCDPRLSQRKTADASGSFIENSYLDTAMMLDSTGNLKKILEGKNVKAKMTWLGRPPSEQTDYVDRD